MYNINKTIFIYLLIIYYPLDRINAYIKNTIFIYLKIYYLFD